MGVWWMPKVAASSARIAAINDLSMQTVAAIRCAVLYSMCHKQIFVMRGDIGVVAKTAP